MYDLHSPLTNDNHISTTKRYNFEIFLKSERKQQAHLVRVVIRAIVAPISFDLIIDRQTIKDYNLIAHFPSHFANEGL